MRGHTPLDPSTPLPPQRICDRVSGPTWGWIHDTAHLRPVSGDGDDGGRGGIGYILTAEIGLWSVE